jgi:uncharacterized RDD family membrane protein YckC
MTREDQLNFCSICTHQKYNTEQGILCGLTNQLADFDTFCGSFIEDTNKTVNVGVRRNINDRSIRAGRLERLINCLIDSFALVAFFFLFAGIVSIMQTIFSPSSLSVLEDENSFLSSLLAFVSIMFYYALFEYKTGQTLGKLITKTKVVTINGEDPNLLAILIRTLCRFIPFEEISFLISNNSGWHDKLSNTKVVKI